MKMEKVLYNGKVLKNYESEKSKKCKGHLFHALKCIWHVVTIQYFHTETSIINYYKGNVVKYHTWHLHKPGYFLLPILGQINLEVKATFSLNPHLEENETLSLLT